MRYSRGARSMGWFAALALCLLLTACRAHAPGGAQVLVDGRPWREAPSNDMEGICVYITIDGAPAATLPFDEAHVVTIQIPGVGENIVRLTGTAPLFDSLDALSEPVEADRPLTMEEAGQDYGFILYRAKIPSAEMRTSRSIGPLSASSRQ